MVDSVAVTGSPRLQGSEPSRCSACGESKSKAEFPKRQRDKKHKRCKDCVANNVPFQRPTKKDYINDTSNEETTIDKRYPTKLEVPKMASTNTQPTSSRLENSPSQGLTKSTLNIEQAPLPEDKDKANANKTDTPSQPNPTNADVQGDSSNPEEENGEEAPVSLEEDIESLARTWAPPVMEPSNGNVTTPTAASPQTPFESEESELGDRTWRETLLLFASPLLDETGAGESVFSGLISLALAGAFIGLISDKNESLPTPWYRFVSAMIGYIYFLCWSVSFYPQVVSNFKRKSTRGLSADFCALNVLGFACYTAYNASLFWSPAVREMYRERYGTDVTVQSNDVAFAIHALLLSSFTLLQTVYYGDAQRPSLIILGTIAALLTLCATFPLFVVFGHWSWLDYLYVLSYVKIGISLIKYIPQVILNFKRKSTVGWSIWNILLDFTGGVLSVLQLVLDCTDMGDFSGITGNLAKFGLGFVSIIFDVVFMVQHYILYTDATHGGAAGPETEPLLTEDERHQELA